LTQHEAPRCWLSATHSAACTCNTALHCTACICNTALHCYLCDADSADEEEESDDGGSEGTATGTDEDYIAEDGEEGGEEDGEEGGEEDGEEDGEEEDEEDGEEGLALPSRGNGVHTAAGELPGTSSACIAGIPMVTHNQSPACVHRWRGGRCGRRYVCINMYMPLS
jgi:hypothetical protein